MSASSKALESLTATYTDSEDEDNLEDNTDGESQENSNTPEGGTPPLDKAASFTPKSDGSISNSQLSVTNTNSTSAFPNGVEVVDLTPPRIQRLVSYFDDTVVSDEEGATTDISKFLASLNGKSNQNSVQHTPESQDLVLDDKEDEDGIVIPPNPPGSCPAEVLSKFKEFSSKMKSGADVNKMIQERKHFRNPSIYEKLIQFCGINEFGSNYPPEVFDPSKWRKNPNYEELAKMQKMKMEKLEKSQKEKAGKTKVEIVVGTAKRTSSPAAEAEAKRKSNWDQFGNPLLAQSAVTTAVSNAKPAVIPAFGSLPKKRL